MKKLLLTIAALMLAAGPAFAVQSTVTWGIPTTGATAPSIRVERGQGADPVVYAQQGPLLAGNVVTFTQLGLALGTRYCYRVTRIGSLGVSPAAVACATPGTPLAVNGLMIIFAPEPDPAP